MKFQPAVKKELLHIAIGTSAFSAVMLVVFGVLAAFGVVKFDYTVLLGAVGGTAVAILNFALMCLTVQAATATDSEKQSRAKMQMSYNFRLLGQAIWCILAFFLAFINPVAGILPLLFPRIVIYILQIAGKHNGKTTTAAPADAGDGGADGGVQ